MNDGRIVQTGALKKMMEAPKNEFVARFLKSQNIFSGVSDGSTLKIGNTVIVKENSYKGDVIVAIRPENIAIVEDKDVQENNVFQGKVQRSILKPYFADVSVDIGISLIMYSMIEREFNMGDSMRVRIPTEKIIVMGKS
jgi:ABC-type Fe3+/spermidine/putrescine transport system ATPase subunit